MARKRNPGAFAAAVGLLAACAAPVAVALYYADRNHASLTSQVMIALLGLATFGFLYFQLFAQQRYAIARGHLTVGSILNGTKIPLARITEVSKVRRAKEGGTSRERVRITYTDAGADHSLMITPRDPMAFVLDLVSRCPQLSEYAETRLIKDKSFSDAFRDTLEDDPAER